MDYVVLDLEWNQCPFGKEEENRELPFEIIEIGAIKLNENMEQTGEFGEVIRPQIYPALHYKTKEIIQIEMKELSTGRYFSEVAKDFFKWCGDEFIFCTWGEVDLTELQRNLKFYNLGYLMGEKPVYFYNVQKLFSILYEDRKKRRTLEFAVEYLGIEKTVPFHRAKSDTFYTARILKKMDFESVKQDFSIDVYYHPRVKKEEIYVTYKTYSKYISREFPGKEEVMSDREVVSTRCYLCGRSLRKKIRWFSCNTKVYYCLASCPEHGYLRGKIRMKKTAEGKIFAIKILKLVDDETAGMIRKKKDELVLKRRIKRQKARIEE